MASGDGNNTWICGVYFTDTFFSEEEPHKAGGRPCCFDCIKTRMDMVIRAVGTDPGTLNGQVPHPEHYDPALFGGKTANDQYTNRFEMKQQ